jgi:ribose transport system ATP-binding protein
MKKEILRMEHISKRFFGVKALDNVKLNLFESEILGLTGLNGSGKTVLVKILSGIYPLDEGAIYLEDHEVSINLSSAAHKYGIFYIGQDSMLVPGLSIKENIFTVRNYSGKFLLDKKNMYAQTKEILGLFGLDIDPNTLVGQLSFAQRHLILICKAISLNSRIIIFDSITGAYSEKDLCVFRDITGVLCRLGISAIYVNNRLDEILNMADRITILKNGRSVRTLYQDEYSREKVTGILAGYEFIDNYQKSKTCIGEEILRVEGLSSRGILTDIHFSLKRGEILGIAGMDEFVRNELENTLFGIHNNPKTSYFIMGSKVRIRSPKDAIKYGIGLIPEHAVHRGLFFNMTISKNVTFIIENKLKNKMGIIHSRLSRYLSKMGLNKLGLINAGSLRTGNLSDIYKLQLVLQKWILMKPKVLILVNPTYGIDMVAKKEVYTVMDEVSRDGAAIILISSDLSELIQMSDRIIILKKGQIQGEIPKEEILKGDVAKEKFFNIFMSK